MSVNFFDSHCQTNIVDSKFGICDDKNDQPAYIDFGNGDKWIAIVENTAKLMVTFTAIDNCIPIYKINGDEANRCDGMLTYLDNIIFVELKKAKTGDWKHKGITQLKETISVFAKNNDLMAYKKRRAFLVNKKHPTFHFSYNQQMQEFNNKHKVRLIIYNTIKIEYSFQGSKR